MVIGCSVEICIDELLVFDFDLFIYFGYLVILCGIYIKIFVNFI